MFRFNPAIVLFIGFELCYYLLIAQTGIIEVFHSDIMKIVFLPIGGILGSYLSSSLNSHMKTKVFILLGFQTLLTILYPHFNPISLFLLGICVGGMAPLIIHTLKKANNTELVLSLCIAYGVGTYIFPLDPIQRGPLGFILSIVAFISYIFINKTKINKTENEKNLTFPLLLMCFWVFLDTALFETLSRDSYISIWRDGFTSEIMFFHMVGIVAGVFLRLDHYQKATSILVLFALSYLFYFLREPILLSVIYPIVISFYNVVILQSLVKIKSLKTIGIYMIFIGWVSSGGGLFVALKHLIIYIPLLFLLVFTYIIYQNYKSISKKEEIYYG